MITTKHLDALATVKFDLLKSKGILKDNLESLKEEIKSDLDQLAGLALPEVCNSRFNYFKLDGTTAEHFAEKILDVEKDKFILAGIRFRGLNINRPFVSINANFKITNDNLPKLAELIKKEFSIFTPHAFQFQLPSEMLISAPEIEIDRYTMVGSMEEISKCDLTKRVETIEVLHINHTHFYDDYLKEYKIFHQKNPALADEVKPESLEDFNDSIKNQLLYEILIDGKKAGIIAGSAYNYYGIRGVCILEEILYDSFKGRGLGAYIQNEFAKKLLGRYELLWGTISSLNQSSLKTALRNGRKVEEIEYSYRL